MLRTFQNFKYRAKIYSNNYIHTKYLNIENSRKTGKVSLTFKIPEGPTGSKSICNLYPFSNIYFELYICV